MFSMCSYILILIYAEALYNFIKTHVLKILMFVEAPASQLLYVANLYLAHYCIQIKIRKYFQCSIH